MSDTQSYKTVTVQNVEIDLLVDGLELLASRLVREVVEYEAADWPTSSDTSQDRLDQVRALMAKLAAK